MRTIGAGSSCQLGYMRLGDASPLTTLYNTSTQGMIGVKVQRNDDGNAFYVYSQPSATDLGNNHINEVEYPNSPGTIQSTTTDAYGNLWGYVTGGDLNDAYTGPASGYILLMNSQGTIFSSDWNPYSNPELQNLADFSTAPVSAVIKTAASEAASDVGKLALDLIPNWVLWTGAGIGTILVIGLLNNAFGKR